MEGLVRCYLGSCCLSQLHYFSSLELTQHGSPLKVVGALCLHPLQRRAHVPKAQWRMWKSGSSVKQDGKLPEVRVSQAVPCSLQFDLHHTSFVRSQFKKTDLKLFLNARIKAMWCPNRTHGDTILLHLTCGNSGTGGEIKSWVSLTLYLNWWLWIYFFIYYFLLYLNLSLWYLASYAVYIFASTILITFITLSLVF